jgi:hypothetical protein
MFFSQILSNKAYSFFFFNIFNRVVKCNAFAKFFSEAACVDVVKKVKQRIHLKKKSKYIRKTFKYTDFFFSKVFFISFYNFIIVSIKVYSRFFKFKKYHKRNVKALHGFF